MADPKKIIQGNVPGNFFVDQSCIDCDACRQIAPDTFGDAIDTACVHSQPLNTSSQRRAAQALLACPVGAIGSRTKINLAPAVADFPLPIDDDIFFCGYHSPKSYGANSYFVRHAQGNWMIDAPRFTPHLVERFQQLGGLRYIFLSHRDDVADARAYALALGAERIIHSLERSAQPDAEQFIIGNDPVEIVEGFTIIPTPGHTRGHCVLLHNNKYLFTGDHVWWSRSKQRLSASRSVCWYSWPEQIASMERLSNLNFEWILPGHGERVHLAAGSQHKLFSELAVRMQQQHHA